MNSIDRIKEICLDRGLAISRLERECGLSNGYIRNMKDGKISAERLQTIADYLGVSYWYLLTGEKDGYYINPETAEMAQELFDNKELRLLFDVAKDVTPDQLRILQQMALSWKNQGTKNGQDE